MLLEKHGADPNTVIPKLNIAPIHYAVGFDDLVFAAKVTALFLKKKANPNLATDVDGLSSLHIACIWGRSEIVKLLLEHGGDLSLKDAENCTPIMYAIHENHYEVIEVIQKFVFEQKIDKKKTELILKSKIQDVQSPLNRRVDESQFNTPTNNRIDSFSTPVKNRLTNALQTLDDKKFTPNRINYNFDATSPYFINITHRRFKSSRDNSQFTESELDKTDENNFDKKNLFDLTKRNLKEFSKQMGQVIVIDRLAIHKRRSYISSWRETIQQIQKEDQRPDIDYINYLNRCNDVTLIEEQKENPAVQVVSSDDSEKEEIKSSSDSFITARSDLQRFENAIRDLPEPKILEHLQEDYIHSDVESGVVFYEKKIISKSRANLQGVDESDHERSLSSVSTKITLPPLDYDTDALRAELKELTGGFPGPINKNTKKLYLKQLVKLKSRPELVLDNKTHQKCKLADIEPHRNLIFISNFSIFT